MKDQEKTKDQLISELEDLRREKQERKRADKVAKQSEDWLRMLFEFAPDAYYLSNRKGIFLDGNKAAEDLLGYKKEELIGKNYLKLNLLPSNQIFKVANLLAGSVLGKSTGPDEFTLIRKDGGHVSVEIRTHPIKFKNETVVLGIARDITERKRAEEALRDSEEKFRTLVETTTEWIWQVNAKGEYTYASPKVKEMQGYAPEEVIGKTPFDFMPSEEAERVGKLFGEYVSDQKPFENLENINMHKEGRKVILETGGAPFFDSEGNLAGYTGIDRDITKRKQLEEQLQIRQRMDSLGTLAGGIAHDFNNLLAGILGYAGLLRSEEGLTDNQIEYADEILKSGQRAADLVARIQTLSRGTISEKTSVDIYELTKDVFGILSQTTDKLIEKQISLKPKTHYVYGSYDEPIRCS